MCGCGDQGRKLAAARNSFYVYYGLTFSDFIIGFRSICEKTT